MLSSCIECFKENGVPNLESLKSEITDDGVYRIECSNGHISYTIFQNEKFEILFDMGAEALNSGYKQEAVVCFASSLERFHEWAINIILFKRGISQEDFCKTWKYVHKQSERQLGAFYFLYLFEFNESPEMVKDEMTNFRNNVIHKGYIPLYKEVFDYGEYILNYIRKIINRLGNEYDDAIMKLNINRQLELKQKYNIGNQSVVVSVHSTIINLVSKESRNNNTSFKEELEFIYKREKYLEGFK